MANDPMRSKAAAVFGKEFMNVVKGNDPKGMQVNSAQALQKRANARPIPVYKDGGAISSRVANRAAMAGYKKGGECGSKKVKTSSDTARKLATEMGGMKDGGGVDDRMKRKTTDIEKDYKIALAKGKNADVAKAKYEQRMADAKDDYAKWTKADRSKTSADEKAAEAALSEARRTKGASVRMRDMRAKTPAAVGKVEQAMNDARMSVTPKIDVPAAKVAAPPRPAVVKTKAAAPAMRAAPAAPAAKPAPKAAPAAAIRTSGVPFMSAKGQAAPAEKKRPLFGEDGVIAGYDSPATAARRLAEGQAKARAGNPFYKSYLEKAESGKVGKYAVGGAGKTRKDQAPIKRKQGGTTKKEGVSTRPTTPSGRRMTMKELEQSNRDTGGMSAAELKKIGEAIGRGNREEYEPIPKAKGGAAKVRKGMMSKSGDILRAVKPKKGIGGIM
jgi:hypothetical protein